MNTDQLDQEIVNQLPPEIVEHIDLLERMRKDFVANVSHELRTPLTVMTGYIEALQDQATDNPDLPTKILAKMQHQATRMQNIIEDLLALSDIETHKPLPVSEEWVDINALINTILQSAEALLQEKSQVLALDIQAQVLLAGEQSELHSLFSNIIFNAIKYTPDAGTITVRWYQEGEQKIFCVQDTGIGIEAKYIPRLTERFYRVDKGRSRNSGGTGLGLAICKHVLIRHHGSLEIESEAGLGSTFRCVFTPSKQKSPLEEGKQEQVVTIL
jgi:two-component system phosphate regulon sensor histidine kinase PhoR